MVLLLTELKLYKLFKIYFLGMNIPFRTKRHSLQILFIPYAVPLGNLLKYLSPFIFNTSPIIFNTASKLRSARVCRMFLHFVIVPCWQNLQSTDLLKKLHFLFQIAALERPELKPEVLEP